MIEMPKAHNPRRGSLAFSPRVRAKKEVGRIKSWVEVSDPKMLGFAGYKAGMTHVFLIDNNKHSATVGQEVFTPVTVVETPPMYVVGYRAYLRKPYGKQAFSEVWAEKIPDTVKKHYKLKKTNADNPKKIEDNLENVEEIRLITLTQPRLVNIPKKTPDVMEHALGGKVEDQFAFAKEHIGKELHINDVFNAGDMIDITAVTIGKGFQGPVKRWGVKLLRANSEKSRRKPGNLGAWTPHRVDWRVPQAGQMGYHQRTEYNKLLVKIGEKTDEITPNGGFIKYGNVQNDYILVKGSLPGPKKRLVRFKKSLRKKGFKEAPELTFISRESHQGR